MKCPQCGARLSDENQFCVKCGAYVQYRGMSSDNSKQLLTATAGGTTALGKKARQARLAADYSDAEFMTTRAYNAVIIGVLLWGILINYVLCARVGDVYRFIDPALFLVFYFICAIAGILLSAKSTDSRLSFVGYNLVVIPLGLVISTLVEAYGGVGSEVVTGAFLYTGLITLGILGMATAFPQLFSKLGGALLGCLGGLILCELLLLIFRVRQDVTDWIAAGIFCLYIGYDIYRSQQFAKTMDNAVDCALDIYLDIANLFIRILSIMGKRKDD